MTHFQLLLSLPKFLRNCVTQKKKRILSFRGIFFCRLAKTEKKKVFFSRKLREKNSARHKRALPIADGSKLLSFFLSERLTFLSDAYAYPRKPLGTILWREMLETSSIGYLWWPNPIFFLFWNLLMRNRDENLSFG